MDSSRPAPMRITSVPPARASAGQSVSVLPLAGSSWPVTIVTWVLSPRWVTGMPAYAGAAIALVMPGTTSKGTPASMSASASSPPRPNTNGSPPLSRTTTATGATVLDQRRVDAVLVHRDPARRLPDVDPLGGGGREVEERGVGEPVVDDDVGPPEQFGPAHRDQPGVPRPGTDEIDRHRPSPFSRAIRDRSVAYCAREAGWGDGITRIPPRRRAARRRRARRGSSRPAARPTLTGSVPIAV